MRPLNQRKKRVIDFVCKCLDLLEGGTINSSRYRSVWENMSDAEFEKFMEDVRANQDRRQIAYFEVEEFKRDLNMSNIEKCAAFMKVPLYEYVAIPDVTGDVDAPVVVTPEPVPVGYAHYKRMPQTTLKKTSLNTNVSKRNPLTGQVTSQEKTARNTDVESYALSAIGAKNALREFQGPRGDDSVMENEMMQAIANDGSVNLSQLTSNPANKTAVNTLNTYFNMQMFCTNLVGPMGVLPQPEYRKK